MVGKIFAVYDKKASAYMPPTVDQCWRTFRRTVKSILMDENADRLRTLRKWPDDFTIYDLGTYDDAKGIVDVNMPPVFVEEVASIVGEIKWDEKPVLEE